MPHVGKKAKMRNHEQMVEMELMQFVKAVHVCRSDFQTVFCIQEHPYFPSSHADKYSSRTSSLNCP